MHSRSFGTKGGSRFKAAHSPPLILLCLIHGFIHCLIQWLRGTGFLQVPSAVISTVEDALGSPYFDTLFDSLFYSRFDSLVWRRPQCLWL
jgi:hypothetical protein